MVNLKVLQPQEVQVFYLLPALRRELARALKALGKDQKTIATLLGVTGAAVSQYISGKRGVEIELPKAFLEKIKRSAADIYDKKSAYEELQRLMRDANATRLICQIHARMDKSMSTCKVCYT